MTSMRLPKKDTTQPLDQIFDGLSRKLQTDFEFLSSQLRHRPSKGFAREYALRELLRQYLPQRLSVGSGAVFDARGSQSNQVDIVIYDTLNTPVIYGAGDIQIFPAECVYAVIEVKSFLGKTELRKSINNIRSIKSLQKSAYVPGQGPVITTTNLYGEELDHFPILGFVFAYDSVKDIGRLKTALCELDDTFDLKNNIDTICVLNRAVITNFDPVSQKRLATKDPNTIRAYILTEKSLLHFYLQLMHPLPQASMRPIQMTKYAEQVVYGRLKV